MVVKKRGLGRGLDALLGITNLSSVDVSETKIKEELRRLPLDQIQRSKYQPRIEISSAALEELAASIRAQGIVQPIVVRPRSNGTFEIIAGERRWRAAQMAGLSEIPALVRDVPDKAAIAMALIENIQRENLNSIEEANAFQRLIDEFGMTYLDISEAVGRSPSTVSNLLRLLALDDEVKHLVENGDLDMGHARALLAFSGEFQRKVARTVAEQGLSVRKTEDLVRRLQQNSNRRASKNKSADPNIKQLENNLAERLGAVVQIQHASGDGGKIVIHYHSLDELDGILAHIK
ncbi:chromosome partitioning protein ParB [Candidatus Nitrosoglobus terrae]|uniref:Probable chromosome-partitioning protein ParB n=1 Tax=Candidatus Nitrosoglobus terrae TaxID=1630141 RepID=A0A1Q2SQ10_9GAMM|nr:ParB/RepB/Spo0J family partition protein [Candidatus Nitrosoglobus terrae]BAW81203.1 chromosome partitioning protein ParB [Candidatus Nitrosoglobus terrae]